MLFMARKEAGYSLAHVAKATNIRFTLLQALENSDYKNLPAPGYVKGFINSYVRYIGLDPQPFLEQYEKETGLDAGNLINKLVGNEEAVRPAQKEHHISLKTALIIAGIVALLFIIGFAIFSSLNKQPSADENPLPPSIEVTSTLDANVSQSEFTPYKLEVSVQKDAATKVILRIDGASVYEGVLAGDNRLEYVVSEKAEITVASPEKIRVLKDGERIRFPEGENIRLEIDAEKR